MKAAPSIDPKEVAKFSALAADWWNPNGKMAPLHRFNPVRLAFIRETAESHFGRSGDRPFAGLSLLDIGCGGGLLSEPMSVLGFKVTGIDASEENVGIAKVHAAESNVDVGYIPATADELVAKAFGYDVILNMEVIEHVTDPAEYMRASTALVKPGGLIFVASLNKTLKSLLLAKLGAEYVLRWLPVGSHDWNRFVPPDTVCKILEEAGLKVMKKQGIIFNPIAWSWERSADTDVNYIVVAARP
jgi:2-polyprenyl-6-hydroxyphenyl methylase/3-demethylubiquinone-9 3-methyltransferase